MEKIYIKKENWKIQIINKSIFEELKKWYSEAIIESEEWIYFFDWDFWKIQNYVKELLKKMWANTFVFRNYIYKLIISVLFIISIWIWISAYYVYTVLDATTKNYSENSKWFFEKISTEINNNTNSNAILYWKIDILENEIKILNKKK